MKILIASSIFPDTIAKLRQHNQVICAFDASEDELHELIKDCDILIFRSGVNITAPILQNASELKLIVRAGSGIDNIDLDYVERFGPELVRIPGPGAQAVAEMTFALMLALARRLLEADSLLRQGHWAKRQLSGYLLNGKTLGIVGAGEIGKRVGQMGKAWGMDVIGCVGRPSPEADDSLRALGIDPAPFEEVVQLADFLCLHVPLKESTSNLIDETVLSSMKPDSFLINLARGGVVDERALFSALTGKGRLKGAALDVHQQEGEGHISPLASLPNVILTPHIGAMTVDSQREIGLQILTTIDNLAVGVPNLG